MVTGRAQRHDGRLPGRDQDNLFTFKIGSLEGSPRDFLRILSQGKIDLSSFPLGELASEFHRIVSSQDPDLLDLDETADQALALAMLVREKARRLFPDDQPAEGNTAALEEGDEEDRGSLEDTIPTLRQRLEEYEEFRRAAEALKRREEIWRRVKGRPVDGALVAKQVAFRQDDSSSERVTLEDLISALEGLLREIDEDDVPVPTEELSIEERMQEIRDKFKDRRRMSFRELFTGPRTRSAIIAAFIALLELIRIGAVRAQQDRHFGEIMVILVDEGESMQDALPK
ncbi:MAG TPA: segregation/condensation protein A [Firmicutes bacterium]|nr:segregation/condensation protein A [Bacillota bacterium]